MKKIFIPTPLDEIIELPKDVTHHVLHVFRHNIEKPITVTGSDNRCGTYQITAEVDGKAQVHTCYNGVNKGKRAREGEQIPKITSQFGLQSATRLHEAGIASNRGSECRGEYVPGSCTHRPSHHGSQ